MGDDAGSSAEAGLFLATLRKDPRAGKKQRHRDELLESLPNNAGRGIASAHAELQKLADALDEKVGALLDAHERDFFLAYKQHMLSVQKEFLTLKTKADEQETKSRREAKIQSLEKELRWFMREALRLDELCKRYKTELERWKEHSDQLEDDRSFLESQIKKARAENRALRAGVERAQNKAYEALGGAEDAEDVVNLPALELTTVEELSEEKEKRYNQTILKMQQLLGVERSRSRKLETVIARTPPPGPLADFFVACVEEVQGHVLERRKANGSPGKHGQAGKGIVRLEDFTAHDKREVIDLLFRNRELLDLMEKKLNEQAEQ